MRALGIVLSAAVLLCVSLSSHAQNPRYAVYVDSDVSPSTGCVVNGPGGEVFAGADIRLQVEVDRDLGQVITRDVAACQGSAFGAATTLSAGYPIGADVGIPLGAGGSADVVEIFLSQAEFPGIPERARVAFLASGAGGSQDALFTINGQASGPGLLLGSFPEVPIPAFGWIGLALLIAIMAAVARTRLRQSRKVSSVMLVGLLCTAAIAAYAGGAFMADGQVGDWSGIAPLGQDAQTDSQPPLPNVEIVAGFGSLSAGNLYFRVDIASIDNQRPVAADDAFTLAEDSVLTIAAPGVLSNDVDAESDPITAQLVSGPALGILALGADGGFSYTPNPDAAGTDSFTYVAFDGRANSAAPATVSLTITAVNDAPVNTVPGAQTLGAGAIVFSTANANAITVSDVDADPGNIQVDLAVGNGTLTAVATAGVAITGNGTGALRLVGLQSNVNTAMDGLSYVPASAGTDILTVTSNDLGNTGDPGPLGDTDSVSLLVDEAPRVTQVTPPDAATQQASNVDVLVEFSEAVNAAAGALSVTCAPSGATASSALASNVTQLVVSGAAIGASEGDLCAITVLAAAVTDVDTIDPPDAMAADFSARYTIDVAPSLVSSVPAEGAVVATTAAFTASFSEPVNLAMGGFTLNCGAPIAVTPSGSGSSTLSFTPTAALPEGANCTATLLAASITDVDAGDPPDTLPANVVVNFSVDAAPAAVGGTPADAATQVATSTAVSFEFSEPVTAGGAAITLDCGGPIAGTVSGSGSATLVFTPSAPLPENAACTATAVATLIDDVDAFDPPANPAADVVRSFTTDAAPSVLNTVPANGALLQPPTGSITINFSEPVNFDTTANAANTSFDLECPLATAADFTVVTASPASSVVLDPDNLAIAGRTCTLTIRAAGITDDDAGDPPDTLAADVVVTIGYDDPVAAVDDSYSVTPHLLLSIGAAGPQGGGVLANDTLGGSGAITGFGPLGSCATAVPNGSNFITTANNGRVVLSANGSFSYAPPGGLAGNGTAPSPEDGFCYTLTGGGTANVAFELANTELVWFVDNNYLGANGASDGTQQRPYTSLAAVAAVDTANDTVHLNASATTYTGGITLESGERLIGSASGSDLATITGITPVAGSGFPALGGMAPTISCSNTNCILLGSNNTLRGFTIGDSGVGGTDIAGFTFGALSVAELTLNGNGRALNLLDGTLNGRFLDVDVSAGTSSGVSLVQVGGTWSVTGRVDIGSVGNAGFVTFFAPTGTSISLDGGLSVNMAASANAVSLNSNNVDASINLGSVAISNTAGGGLAVNNSPVTITGTGSSIAVSDLALNLQDANLVGGATFASVSSSASPVEGINIINGLSGSLTINGGAISGSAGTAFRVEGDLGGGVSYAGSLSKTSAGRLVDVGPGASGIGNLTLSGNLSCTGSCGTGAGNNGIRVTGRTGGTITFSGASKTFSASAANPGISLAGNAGATINFSGGGLAVTSTTGNAFDATGGGTVSVTGANNTLSNTSGIALRVDSTTIAASGLNFQSISSDGGVNGILLRNTGTSGGLSVTGVGSTAGSGGTIQNKTADGIRLESTQAVSLANMNLSNNASPNGPGPCGDNLTGNTGCNAAIDMQTVANVTLNGLSITGDPQVGINGNGVAGFILDNSTISGAGNAVQEDGVRFINLTGTSRIRNTTLQNSHDNHLRVYNTVATPLILTIDQTVAGTSRFLSTVINDGILFEGVGSASMGLIVNNTLFDSSSGDHIQTVIDDTAVMNLSITNNTMTATNPAVLGSGITLSSGGAFSGSKVFNISNNTINGANAKAINVNLGTTTLDGGTGTYSGTVANNAIGSSGVAESGGFGIDVVGNGGGTLTSAVTGNTIRQFLGDHGIRVLHRDGSGRINATVTGNTVTQPEPFGFNGVFVQSGATSGPPIDSGTLCLEISGNSIVGSGAGPSPFTDFRLRQRFNTTFQLRGYTGGTTDTAAVVTHVQSLNSGGPSGSATAESVAPSGSGFINTPSGAACPQP